MYGFGEGFNPRAHVGRDKGVLCKRLASRVVSIHAPTWGATVVSLGFPMVAVFQSTRPRGARLSNTLFFVSSIIVSIHAPTWGATLHCVAALRV